MRHGKLWPAQCQGHCITETAETAGERGAPALAGKVRWVGDCSTPRAVRF